jgi:archaemetzincin
MSRIKKSRFLYSFIFIVIIFIIFFLFFKDNISKTGSSMQINKTSSSITSLQEVIKKITPLHKKLLKPQPGDWLDRFTEPGQSFKEYINSAPIKPNKNRNIIAVLKIGNFSSLQEKILQKTVTFMRLYFNLPVKVLKSVSDEIVPKNARRIHPDWGMKQFLSTYILDKVLKPRLKNSYLVLFGITATDLWPGKGWNFVFGQASLSERVAVQSIFRNGNINGGNAEYGLFLRRTLKTATHEMGHVISIKHCTAFECNMCGSNHREESDRHPLWMCPQCLAKIYWAVGADSVERYERLLDFCKTNGLNAEEEFYKRSIKALKEKL